MKIYIFILLSVLLLNTTTISGQTQVTRYTPNGSPVRAYNAITEMSSADKINWSNHVSTYYPLATELNPHSATRSYNCHAYAWHISEGGDNVWIGYYSGQETDEDIYWTDGSYIEQSNEMGAEKISYYADNHSAIQTSTQGIYKSKWGEGPLMSHSRAYGPSVYNMNYRKYYKSNSQPYISGPNTVCTSNTLFTLQEASPSSVSWQVSSNVQLVSSNNSNATIRSKYANSTSTGWIKASFDGLVITKDFGVNGDVDEIPMSVTVNLVNNYLTITIHDGSGQTPYYLYLNNVYKLSTNSRTITFPYYQSSGRVKIKNRNSCDTGWNYAYYTGYFGGSGYYSYTISPNPVSDILTLERKDDLKLANANNLKTDEKSRYELYNYNQILVSKGQINNLAKIDVSGFKSGIYVLLIITEGVYESHRLIIN